MSPTSLHTRDTNSSIFQNPGEKRGFIVVIILSVLATVGMFCLIITLVICKNKRDRKKRAAKMDAEKSLNFLPGRKGRYRKLEDEDEGEVWSVEMDDRRPTAYQGRYSEGNIQRLEEELEKMELSRPLGTEQHREDDRPKAPLDKTSMSQTPEERKSTEDDPKDEVVCTAEVDSCSTPNLKRPIPSTATEEIFSPFPSTVWVITQTRVVFTTLRTLCLCTSFSTSKAVLYRLRDEFSSRPSLNVSERTKRALREYYVVHDHSDSEEEENGIGFDVLMDETEGVLYHVNTSRAKGNKWQGKITDGKVFGDGFTEVTVENVRRVLRGWK
ncbi:hypothetical protein J4E90_003507 [Alternaria incomplexa]|uniref:uncharacterized protein n=1 Tax=Alternaria incomplexa TaxID=1187928 RepID=UPI00221EEB3A|nr:uncharacterized protein J4E90_003507 [Alternaria incomplexa]KAI4917002.1 hypothetical protein J4E90_003507 [Alternaria incomplexa]